MLVRLLNAGIPLENIWTVLQHVKIISSSLVWDTNEEHWKHDPSKNL